MTGIQPFAVETHLARPDWAALQKVWGERVRARVGRARLLAATFAPLLGAAALVLALRLGRAPLGLAAFLIGVLAMLGAVVWTTRLFRRFSLPDEDGLVLGSVRMEFSSEGLRILRGSSVAVTQWSALREITRTDTHLFLWVDQLSAYIVPLRDLPPGMDAAAVIESTRGFAGPVRATPPSDAVATAPAAAVAPPPSPSRHGYLGALARRLAWRAVPTEGPGSSDAVILLCALAALAVWLAFDRFAAGANARFFASGVAGLSWYASFVLALAWVLHRASLATAGFRVLLAAIVGGLPLGLGLGLALHQWAPACTRGPGYALLGLAAALHLRRSLVAAGASRQRLALLAGALLALVFARATSQTWVYPHLWYAADEDDEEDATDWAEGERLLFEQPDRIDAAAARLAAGRPDRPDVFFLGFAGVGEQKVFAEELKLSQRVVEERYAAAGRSLLLVNDRRDRDSQPLATVRGLRRALTRIGERMDRADDVLFLMLTSHGSDTPSLSVSNGGWPLEQLEGRSLRAALDASGIRWRVIVISACHSGAFIEPLADESSIILTSAAGDRTSFGCSDDRDVTDFGAAFIRDALPQAESLASAFERAKQAIADRERRDETPPSSPQAHFGSAISAHWERIEAARRARAAR